MADPIRVPGERPGVEERIAEWLCDGRCRGASGERPPERDRDENVCRRRQRCLMMR
jgi:hypothetical protein